MVPVQSSRSRASRKKWTTVSVRHSGDYPEDKPEAVTRFTHEGDVQRYVSQILSHPGDITQIIIT